MALIGNASLLHKSPAKYTTGTVGFCDRANWNKPGMMRSRGDLTLSLLWKYDALPSGTYAGRAFLPPQQAGRITTRSAFAVDAAASGAEGLPGAAGGSMTVTAAAIGGLFAGGVASGSITVSAVAAIAGLAAGSAAATVAVNALATPGGIAFGVASGLLTVTGAAEGYGRGYMQASTVDTTVLTPASVASAVWSSAIEAGFTAEQLLRILAAHAAGAATGLESANPQFLGLDGTTVRIDGTYAAGTRTIDALDGA